MTDTERQLCAEIGRTIGVHVRVTNATARQVYWISGSRYMEVKIVDGKIRVLPWLGTGYTYFELEDPQLTDNIKHYLTKNGILAR